MLSDEDMYERMRVGWRGGIYDGTICGIGSTMENTVNVREWLPRMCEKYGIKSLNDAGCGDCHWIDSVGWYGLRTLGFYDLIPRDRRVMQLDICKETMPTADAILCRHVANHLDEIRVRMALDRFRECAPYLFATQFDQYDGTKEFTRLDLRKWLGEPIEQTEDGGAQGCKLAMWKL